MRRCAPILALPLALSLPLLSACSSNDDKTPANEAKTLSVASVKPLLQTAGTDKVVSLAVTNSAVTARLVQHKTVTAWMFKDGKASEFKARAMDPAAAAALGKIDLAAIEKAADKACPAAASQLTLALSSEHTLTLLRCGKEKEAKAVLVDAKPFAKVSDRFSDAGMTTALQMAAAASPKGGPLAVDLSNPDSLSVTFPDATSPLGKACKSPEVLLPLTPKGSMSVQTPTCNTTKKSRGLKPVELAKLDPKKTAKAFNTAASTLKTTVKQCQMMEIRGDASGKPVAAVTCTSQGKPAAASAPIG